MPLAFVQGRFPLLEKHWPLLEGLFWVAFFAFAYVAMMKFMHPSWTIFGY